LSCRLQRLLLVSWHSESFFTSQPQAPFSYEGYQCPLETIGRIPPFPGNLAFPTKLRIILGVHWDCRQGCRVGE
jgi:hypothetical protein